jgi:hypothetical protein
MAKVLLRKQRRYRVQISLTQDAWDTYQANLVLAKELKAEIDFSGDFEPWFNKQNQAVKAELDRLQSTMKTAPTAASAVGGQGRPGAKGATTPAGEQLQNGGATDGND